MLVCILWMILALEALVKAYPYLVSRNLIEQIFCVIIFTVGAPFIHASAVIKACYYLWTGKIYEIDDDNDDFLDKINRR